MLVTGRDMPIDDVEGPQLVEHLGSLGCRAEVREWGIDDRYDAGLVVVRSTWDYTERREEFLGWLQRVEATSRVVNPREVIAWNSHKSYLLELAGAGVPVVPTQVVNAAAPAEEQRAALAASGDRVVVKPAVGAGARGAMFAPATDPQLVAHLAELVRHRDVLVQPYVEAIATSGEVSLVYFNGELSHAVRKLPGVGDYRIHEHLGGSTQRSVPSNAELSVAGSALRHVDTSAPLTYARVDLVELPSGPAVMELELIEPFLYLSHAPGAAERFAAVLFGELSRSG